jgi:hypothetical protein
MLWWDWTARQRLALLALMLTIAVAPWLMLGFLPRTSYNLGVVAGGTAFLIMPQIIAWFLFVGLRTGRMPVRFGSEHRISSPAWFWCVAALYAALLVLFLWMIIAVVLDMPMPTV